MSFFQPGIVVSTAVHCISQGCPAGSVNTLLLLVTRLQHIFTMDLSSQNHISSYKPVEQSNE